MPVYRDFAEVGYNKRTIVSLGTFDGVHLGHREIISQLAAKATERDCRSLLITFDPHPKSVLGNGNNNRLLTPINEKIELFRASGIENILVINFTKEFSEIPYDKFLTGYIGENIGLDSIIIGHDHRFGKGRGGDFSKIEELAGKSGFNAFFVPPFSINGTVVSSTNIRDSLNAGDVKAAGALLGRGYSFEGEVIEGFRRGRTIGFPTANVGKIDGVKFLPANGVYAVEVTVSGKEYRGVMNLGVRPTFGNEAIVLPEIHIFDFYGEAYGEKIKVIFTERIRDEKKFASVEELVKQISADAARAKEIFNIN